MSRPTRLEIDLDAVRHNVAHLGAVAGAPVCAVVKADGYGHGAVAVARAALDAGAVWLAVALVEEGVALREAGIDAPLLLLSEPADADLPALLEAGLTPVVYRPGFIAALAAEVRSRARGPLGVHVKADTGMGRVGARPAQWEQVLRAVADAPELVVDGLLTHLACADDPTAAGEATTREQLAGFDRFLALATQLGIRPRWVHAANTAGLLRFPDARRGLVRPGIGIYGLSPDVEVVAADHGLRPALRLVSAVSYAKHLPAGTPVSYGHRWRTPADGWVATVPVGYADGVPRALTNRGQALLGGVRRPIAGTVTMDQLLLWCGDDEPRIGAPVVLLGTQGDEQLPVEEWAAHADTITYEIVTQLTARLPRHHLG